MKKIFPLLLMVVLGLSCMTGKVQEKTGSFVTLSDIHFDPFYDPSIVPELIKADVSRWPVIFDTSMHKALGDYSADSSGPLVLSAFEAVKKEAPDMKYIFFPGDFLSHGFDEMYEKYNGSQEGYDSFVTKTMKYLAERFREFFPGIPVIPALGNNDSFSGDYNIKAGGDFLKMFTDLWSPFFYNKKNRDSFMATFPIGGYYIIDHPVLEGQKVLVLNANFFSHKYSQGNTAGDNQLLWFQQNLEECRQNKTPLWLIYHEPPGIDVYSTLKGGDICAGEVTTMWTADFNKRFLDLIREYHAIIKMAFLGHTHMDDFRLVNRGDEVVSLGHIVPAVSPLFGNNPGFQLFTYIPVKGILDYKTLYLSNLTEAASTAEACWLTEYNFTDAYDQTEYSPATAAEVYRELEQNSGFQKTFIDYYDISAPSVAISTEQWNAYYAGTGYAGVAQFTGAYCSRH